MTVGYGDIVVIIPGIMGTALANDAGPIWGWEGSVLVRNLLTLGGALKRDLTVVGDSPMAESLDDGVRPTKVLSDLHLIPGFWKVDGYGALQQSLKETFDLSLGENLRPFPYDWRRDNRAAAHRLKHESQSWLHSWRESSGNQAAKLVLVAHSMGGLIARYFLEVLEGWRDTRALITFGTPYSGSLNAVDMLVVGKRMFGIDIADAARSMYSMHQLLPTFPCCDTGDGGLKQLDEVSLPGLDPARFASAREFHREIREAALRNKQDEKYSTRPYAICPIVGMNQPTRNSMRLRGPDVTLLDEIGDSTPGGDGTVPRRSAVPDGFDRLSAMYSSTRHGRLQNHDSVVDHVSGLLKVLKEDKPCRGGKPLSPGNISVALDDAYTFPSAISVRAKPSNEEMRLQLEVKSRATGAVERGVMVRDGGDWQQRVFKPREPGLYLITVSAVVGKAEPVEDVIEVVAA